ncbi:MAG TPA: VOC family protein [Candidatus Acidoferrum sp.]|nr:VOC family protein [Candidatus Acidoferrum sp.]
MFKARAAFSGFSVDDLGRAKEFYTKTLGLEIEDERMGIRFRLPAGGTIFAYPKPNHVPATFTILNFVVDNIDVTVDELTNLGVKFEQYENPKTDERGVARGEQGAPAMAWFKDPAGNILAVLENSDDV